MNDVLLWGVFAVVVIGLLALDLGVFHRRAHTVTLREALGWSAVWIAVALAFNGVVYIWLGADTALEFLTGYLIEKTLSIDTLFVFLLLFSFFRVPSKYQHRVLFWGIVGALVMRMLLIALGITLIQKFEWLLYVFGGFLVLTGLKMALQKDRKVDPERNLVLRGLRRVLPVTASYAEGSFFVRKDGRRFATPLFMVLVMIETADLIFAIDSIPAIMAITLDPFVVYTSNVFALLGLRSLYFAVAGILPFFHHLHYGLSAILAFAGLKMVLADIYKIPVGAALGVVGGILLVTMIASVARPRRAQIAALMDQGIQTGQFKEAEADLVERALRLTDRRAAGLMTARAEIVWLDPADPPDTIRGKVTGSPHSHFPVARESLDTVLGIVDAKHLLARAMAGEPIDLETAMRPPLFVPEMMPALKVLELFRRSGVHQALVIDEYGVVAGLLTLSDIVEAIVGDMAPAEANGEVEVAKRKDGSWLLDGMMSVEELTARLELEPVAAEERGLSHTLGGLVMTQLGRIPAAGDRFEWRGLSFEVAEMDGQRVDKVLITPPAGDTRPSA